MTDPSLVSVLVVNYNGRRHLDGCLSGLENQTLPRHRFEVVLVDNASRDGSAEHVRERFPWVRLVALPENVGFAEGNNVAARHAHGGRLALLNNDTVPDPFWLEELLRAADEAGGSAASKLVFAHDPTLVNSGGLTLLRDGRGADLGFRQSDDGRWEGGGPVFAGCGAGVLVPWPPAGEPLLDPRFFLYYEDLDAAWRGRLAGRGCVLAPRSLVRHAVGAAAGDRSPVFWFHVERNRALAALRNADPFLALWSGLGLFARAMRAVLLAAAGRRTWPVAGAVVRAVTAYLAMAPRTLTERYAVRCWKV